MWKLPLNVCSINDWTHTVLWNLSVLVLFIFRMRCYVLIIILSSTGGTVWHGVQVDIVTGKGINRPFLTYLLTRSCRVLSFARKYFDILRTRDAHFCHHKSQSFIWFASWPISMPRDTLGVECQRGLENTRRRCWNLCQEAFLSTAVLVPPPM